MTKQSTTIHTFNYLSDYKSTHGCLSGATWITIFR